MKKTMQSKEFLKKLCDILFKNYSYVIKNGVPSKSTTISKFFSDKARDVPSKKICNLITERCRYNLYFEDEQKIKSFSTRIVFFFTSILNHNCCFYNITNSFNDGIDERKRDNLFKILKLFINQAQSCKEIDLDTLRLANKYYMVLSRDDIKDKENIKEYKYTKQEIDIFRLYTTESISTMMRYIDLDQIQKEEELKRDNKEAIAKMNYVLEHLRIILETEQNISFEQHNQSIDGNILLSYSKYLADENMKEWKKICFDSITYNGLKTENVQEFLEFFRDLLTCNSPNEISIKNKNFFQKCINTSSYNSKEWKARWFAQVFNSLNNQEFICKFITYYNMTYDYLSGIEVLINYQDKLNDLKKRYCINGIVNKIKSHSNINSESYFRNADENSLLYADTSYSQFENLIESILKYLSFQLNIYMDYCID